jgi:hypothetical protein
MRLDKGNIEGSHDTIGGRVPAAISLGAWFIANELAEIRAGTYFRGGSLMEDIGVATNFA